MSERLYKIGEAAQALELKSYVLRFWETEFTQLAPTRTETGQRLYSEEDLKLLRRIKNLLHERGLTIEGARKLLADFSAVAVSKTRAPLMPELKARPNQSVIDAEDPGLSSRLLDEGYHSVFSELGSAASKSSRPGDRLGGETVLADKDLSASLEAANIRLADSIREAETLRGRMELLGAKTAALLVERDAARQEAERFKSESGSVQLANDDLQSLVRSLKNDLHDLRSGADPLKTENLELRAEKESLQAHVQELEDQLLALMEEHETAQEQLKILKKESEAGQARFAALEDQKNTLQSENSSWQSELLSLESEYTALIAENEDLKARNQSSQLHCETLGTELESLQLALASARDAKSAFRGELEKLASTVQFRSARITRLEDVQSGVREEIAELCRILSSSVEKHS